MYRNTLEWRRLFEKKRALWIHDGDSRRPHVVLRSELHSNGFFMAKLLTEDDNLRLEMVRGIVDSLGDVHAQRILSVDRVVGPATGATKLAKTMAEEISRMRGTPCFWASPEKVEGGGKITMVFKDPENCVKEGEKVLLIEDVLSTGGSVQRTEEAVKLLGGTCGLDVVTLVNRSGRSLINDKKVSALIHHDLPMWEEKVCPLCKAGSKAISPKTPATNWDLLTGYF